MKCLSFSKTANNGSFWVMFESKVNSKQVKIAGKSVTLPGVQFINIVENPAGIFTVGKAITAAEAAALGLK